MEVTIISTETIKPSSPSIKNNKPHELCLFDQLFPLTYTTGVTFYPNYCTINSDFSKTLIHLKESLSETLNLYYPFSGRIKDDIYVDDFDAGVPFLEVSVNCPMVEMLINDTDAINKLVPFPSFRRERDAAAATPIPMLGVQATAFACGGIAMGVSVCHKLADGVSMLYLLSSWAALSRGAPDEVIKPNFSDAAVLFPAVKDIPEKYPGHFDRAILREGNYVMKTFTFGAEAVETLREKARSDCIPTPTRNEAVTCFIWKHATESAWAATGSRNPLSLAAQAVNLRGRLKSWNGIGNLFWTVIAAASTDESVEESTELKLPELAKALKGAMDDYHQTIDSIAEQGYKKGSGSEALMRKLSWGLSFREQLVVKPQEIMFSNLKGFFNGIDFGWGKPIKVAAMGNPGPACCNIVFFIDSPSGKGMEATMLLEEKLMAVLERDVNFLAFASPNAGI